MIDRLDLLYNRENTNCGSWKQPYAELHVQELLKINHKQPSRIVVAFPTMTGPK